MISRKKLHNPTSIHMHGWKSLVGSPVASEHEKSDNIAGLSTLIQVKT
jgi:hypothetical protein